MVRLFLNLYDWLSARRKTAVALVLGVTALLVLSLCRLHYEEDIAKFLPLDSQNREQSAVYDYLNDQTTVAVIFRPDSAFCGTAVPDDVPSDSKISVTAAMDEFARQWQLADSLHRMPALDARVDDRGALQMINFVQEHYPYFLTEADYVRMDSLLARPDYVADRLAEGRKSLTLLTGSYTARMLRTDPLNLFSPVLLRFAALGSSTGFHTSDGHLIHTADGAGVVFFESADGGSETANNARLARFVDEVIAQTEARCPGVKVSAVGSPLIAAGNASRIKKDSFLAVALALAGILLVLFLAFRRWNDLLWMAASIGFGILFSLGVIACFKSAISIIVIGIGSILVGIAANYPLHFLHHLSHSGDNRASLAEMVKPLLVGNITTVGAFLCLIFVKAQAMHDLAWFGSLMLVGTILFTLVFLPVLVKPRRPAVSGQAAEPSSDQREFAGKATRESAGKKRAADAFGNPSPRRRRLHQAVPWVLVAITVWLSFQSQGDLFDADMHHINYMTPQQEADMAFLSAGLEQATGMKQLYVVCQGPDMETCLQEGESLSRVLATLRTDEDLSMSNLSDFVPSRREQEARLQRWSDFWAVHSETLDQLARESRRLGFSEKAFSRFTASVATDWQPMEAADFQPVLNLLESKFLMAADTVVRTIAYASVQPGRAESLKQTVAAQPGCFAFEPSDVMGSLVNSLSDDFNYVLWACGFIVFFFLWLSFRNLELALLAFLPLTVGWIWILGIMNLLGIQFNIVSIILATFIFGQGDDYTIFITEGLVSEYQTGRRLLADRRQSIFISALLMFIGIGTLVFARHPAMRSLGIITVLGMMVVVLMANYLPEWVFRWLTTKNGRRRLEPVSVMRLLRTAWAFLLFALSMLVLTPVVLLMRDRERVHRLICRYFNFAVHRVPGTKFVLNNPAGETFDRPAVVVSNHQSHLDLMCLLMLHPKMVVVTNRWVWHNPFYGAIIHKAEFVPAAEGVEEALPQFKALAERGYSIVIFPEGTRSVDGSVLRFHKGAFYVADQLGLDVLPVYLRGVGHVLPKLEFMLRRGTMEVEIGRRLTPADATFGLDYRERAVNLRLHYQQKLASEKGTVIGLSEEEFRHAIISETGSDVCETEPGACDTETGARETKTGTCGADTAGKEDRL